MVALHERLRPNDGDIAAQVIDGEAILINLSNGMYYSMDKVGGKVWQMIEDGHPLGEIADIVTALYDAPHKQVNADVERLASQLLDENLVIMSDDNAPPSKKVEMELQQDERYETPKLNIYRDMGDLLALDPPAPGLQEIAWKEPNS